MVFTVVTHTCQVLRFRRGHYSFLDKLKTTGIVRCVYGNHLIAFGVFLDERMGLSQYR